MSMNAIHCWGVVTGNKEKADKIFAEVEKEYEGHIVKRIVSSIQRVTYFEGGHRLIWVRPSQNARGYRFHRIWLDKDIVDEEILRCVIFPKLYCNREDIIWI